MGGKETTRPSICHCLFASEDIGKVTENWVIHDVLEK